MTVLSQIFSCKRCGNCCHGETTVSLNAEDRKRMVAFFNIPEEVQDRFWRITGTTVQMKTLDGHCIFYDDGCEIYKGRPWRCAEWPLHPSILSDENNYHIIANSCPGINRGIGYKKFCEILSKLIKLR